MPSSNYYLELLGGGGAGVGIGETYWAGTDDVIRNWKMYADSKRVSSVAWLTSKGLIRGVGVVGNSGF